MNDLPLLAYLARTNDPETSHAAGRKARLFAADHRQLILTYLKTIYPASAHYIGIAEGTGLEKHAVGRRLGELKLAGKILVAGSLPLPNGNKATAYRLVAEQRAAA
jgi:hypothetical protein